MPLTIVLLDNGGGGIFDFLPVARQTDDYEEHVATPTGLDVARIAALRPRHVPVATLPSCARRRPGLGSAGTPLVHVRTDRAANVALHAVWAAVAAARASRCRRACRLSGPRASVRGSRIALQPRRDPSRRRVADVERARRRSSKGIAPGDVVEVDRAAGASRSWTSIHQRASGAATSTCACSTAHDVLHGDDPLRSSAVWRRAA